MWWRDDNNQYYYALMCASSQLLYDFQPHIYECGGRYNGISRSVHAVLYRYMSIQLAYVMLFIDDHRYEEESHLI